MFGAVWIALGQGAATVRMKDFQTHSTDKQGRRLFVKGDNADPLTNDVVRITRPRVDTFKADGALELKIEAAEAFYHMRSNSIWSAKELAVRSGDEKMSIQGVGFAWNPESSTLAISNQVAAILRRDALATNQAAGATNFVRITAERMSHRAEAITFEGKVRVTEAEGSVECDLLKVNLDAKTQPKFIEALGNVFLVQGKTEARGARATYDRERGILRLFEKTRWQMEDRRGESETLMLDQKQNSLRAETNVRITIPSSLVATNAAASGKANEVVVTAESFDYAPTNAMTRGGIAIFNGNVRATEPQANLACSLLTIFFDATNRLARAVADRDVVITAEQAEVKGTRAVFEKDEIAITGPPSWVVEKRTGSSDLLVLNTRTREIRALTNVTMRIPSAALPTSILSPTNAEPRTNSMTELFVKADVFTHRTNAAVFAGKVRVLEERGQIDADQIDLRFGEANRVERITATGDVILTHETTQAIGQTADYDLLTQTIRLTGSPKVWTEDREIDAREFLIDRKTGEFRALPPYKIKLRRVEKAVSAAR